RKISADADFAALSTHISLANIFAGLVFTYLFRISGNRRLSLGSPLANRPSKVMRETIGLLMQVAPLSVTIADEETFSTLIQKIRQALAENMENSLYVKGNPPQAKTYDVLF